MDLINKKKQKINYKFEIKSNLLSNIKKNKIPKPISLIET